MKLVKEHINEKFTEEGDPIKDMRIGDPWTSIKQGMKMKVKTNLSISSSGTIDPFFQPGMYQFFQPGIYQCYTFVKGEIVKITGIYQPDIYYPVSLNCYDVVGEFALYLKSWDNKETYVRATLEQFKNNFEIVI